MAVVVVVVVVVVTCSYNHNVITIVVSFQKGKDGCLYFIPENGYRVLKVTPPKEPPTLMNGKLPENDVLLELL